MWIPLGMLQYLLLYVQCNRQAYSTTHKYAGGMFWHTKFVAKTYSQYSFATEILAKTYPWYNFAMICLCQNIPGGMFWCKQIVDKLYQG